ncbi:MAG: CapA family protein, partial [Myxococcales bacterium]|nr:CapA family protein [Myxococcales bacterium]
ITYYGAGVNRSAAAATTLHPDINGVGLAMQGFCNLSGTSYGDTPLHIIAYDDPTKGGALPAYTSSLDDFVDGEVGGGRLTVPIIHGGTEYALMQSSGTRNDFARTVDHGADLVIAHHPHVVHGIATYDAGNGPVYVVGSLGNFVFDQERFEVFRSYLAVVDVVDGANGPAVEAVNLVPIRIDDYAPRLMAGEALDKMGRHVAHMSTQEALAEDPGSNYGSAVVYAAGGRLRVAMDESQVSTTDLVDQRSVALSGGSTGPVALDPYAGNDALAALHSDVAASCQVGRDLLNIGDFEDPDVDETFLEGDVWEQSEYHYVQSSETRNGNGAGVLLRKSSSSGRTSMYLLEEVEVTPGSTVTFQGWSKLANAGDFEVSIRLRKTSGSTYSYTDEHLDTGVNHDWQSFTINKTIPSNVDTVQIYLRQYPPSSGEGMVFLDDISIIQWDGQQLAVDAGGVTLPTPNAWDFVRCSAPGNSLDLDLT